MKKEKGHITVATATTMALTLVAMIGGISAWTFSQFEGVNANAAMTLYTANAAIMAAQTALANAQTPEQ